MRRLLLCLGLVLTALASRTLAGAAPLPADAAGQSPGSLVGTVHAPDGTPVTGAAVRLVGKTRSAVTDAKGAFRFDHLLAGNYLVEIDSDRYGSSAAAATVAAGETASLDVTVDLAIHREEIVVTVGTEAQSLADVAQPVGVLAGEELAQAARASLGETLAQQPGVSSTSFGAGASRPVIRGQGGNRIRILENGIGSTDASDVSPDHAVALEPIDAEKIEVVRGPATLLDGSNAIGGVVNVLDGHIPEYLPSEPLTGTVSLIGASNADERAGDAELSGALGRVAWNASGFKRDTKSYSSGDGQVVNSDLESKGGSFGFSWIGEGGFVGVSGRSLDSNYGNPAEEVVRIDLQQRRYDFRAGTSRQLGIFDGARLRFAKNDYEHGEIEGGELGTRFVSDSWETRLDLPHRQLGAFHGSFGAQVSKRKFEAIGEEAFVPPTDTDNKAAFLFEEVGGGTVRGQLGVRYERQSSSAVGERSRDFSATSASLGGVWQTSPSLDVALTVSRAIKLPAPEELYANGPHLATGVFEIGDPNLAEETTTGVDLALHQHSGRVHSELSVFANRADNFTIDELTGETMVIGEGDDAEELPVVRFVQRDAKFRGAEAQVHVELLHADPNHLDLELFGDTVRAERRDTGAPLPRIPAARYGAGLRYQGSALSGSLFVRRTQSQDRVAEFETPTDAFTMLDAAVGYRVISGRVVHDLLLSGTNLTDELAKNHVSFLKDVAPLPGRDVRLTYRLSF